MDNISWYIHYETRISHIHRFTLYQVISAIMLIRYCIIKCCILQNFKSSKRGLCRCNLILCRKQQKLGKRSSCAMDFSVISASSHMHNFCNFLVTLDWKTKKYTNDSFTYRACNTLASHKFSVRVRKFRFCMLINSFVYISNLISYVRTITLHNS